jgi:hypothetical protein
MEDRRREILEIEKLKASPPAQANTKIQES